MSTQFSEYILFSIYHHFKTFEIPAFLLKYFYSNKKTIITVFNSDDSLPIIYLFFVTFIRRHYLLLLSLEKGVYLVSPPTLEDSLR